MPAKITADLQQATEKAKILTRAIVRLNRVSARSAVTSGRGAGDPSVRAAALEQEFRQRGLLA